eukprot:g3636.t1
MTAPDTTPNTAAVGLVFDINPADPAVISVLVGVATLLLFAAVCFRNGKCQRRNGGGGVGGEEQHQEQQQQQQQHKGQTPEAAVTSRPRYNTRGHRVAASPPGSGGSPVGKAMTPQQAALCEVLYDVYAGSVPARGIESKTVRECNLSTADIRRQFKHIKQAREAAVSSGGTSPPPRLATRRSVGAKKPPQPSPAKQTLSSSRGTSAASPVKAPASPRRTPVKRGAATRPAPSTPRSGKRSTGPPSASKAKASVLPSPSRLRTTQASPGSPMSTRGKSSRASPLRVGSPKSTPTKRAAATAGGGGSSSFSSPRSASGTPSKRGKSSVLEMARREAQQQAADVASTRASNLRAKASGAGKRGTKS